MTHGLGDSKPLVTDCVVLKPTNQDIFMYVCVCVSLNLWSTHFMVSYITQLSALSISRDHAVSHVCFLSVLAH